MLSKFFILLALLTTNDVYQVVTTISIWFMRGASYMEKGRKRRSAWREEEGWKIKWNMKKFCSHREIHKFIYISADKAEKVEVGWRILPAWLHTITIYFSVCCRKWKFFSPMTGNIFLQTFDASHRVGFIK